MSIEVEDFKRPFGNFLRTLRKDAGTTQLELAVALGVDHSMVSKWETGSFSPTYRQVKEICGFLELTHESADALEYAWSREQSPMFRGPMSLDPEQIIQSILTSIRAVRSLRNAGHARAAEELGKRDSALVFNQIRSIGWGDQHQEMLRLASELLLENVKANLDFLQRHEVAEGALGRQLSWLRAIEAASQSDQTKFFSALAEEGNDYVSGNVSEALKNSQMLLGLELEVPMIWRLELLRASAINAGKLTEPSALQKTDEQVQEFLDKHTDELTSDEHSFLLEGLSRGWSGASPEKALRTIEEIWKIREKSGESDSASQLRFVQLVRTHAETERKYTGAAPSREMRAFLERALKVSEKNGYDRYIDQLKALLAGDK